VILPLGQMLSVFHGAASALRDPVVKIEEFMEQFRQKMDDLLLGPNALGGVKDSLEGLVERLRGIDLQFLVRELQAVFDEVKTKLQAVSPTTIRASVEDAFNSALNLLDTSHLLPQAEINTIDADYKRLVDDLKQLDPKKLVIDAVQPVFDNTVLPLLQVFDVSAILNILIERLDGLKVELQAELERTNTAYQAMLQAVPPISLDLGDIDIGVDIGGDLGF